MALLHPLQLLAVVFCSLCVLVRAGEVAMGGFSTSYGMTGCISDPKHSCVDGKGGDICYVDRGLGFAISGTSPLCSACMPKNHRNIAIYQFPQNLPCALWRAYDCDDLFVTHVWHKSGSNSCWMGGRKSYNINNWFNSASEAQSEFIKQCRQEKTRADYGLPAGTTKITEKDFCFPLRNNITMVDDNKKAFSSYKEYYDNKYMKN